MHADLIPSQAAGRPYAGGTSSIDCHDASRTTYRTPFVVGCAARAPRSTWTITDAGVGRASSQSSTE